MRSRFFVVGALLTTGCVAIDDTDPEHIGEVAQPAAAAGARWLVDDENVIRYYIDTTGEAAQLTSQASCSHAVDDGFGTQEETEAMLEAIDEAIERYEAQTPLRFEELSSLPTGSASPGYPVLIFTRGDYDVAHGSNPPSGGYNNWAGCVYFPDTINITTRTVQHEVGHCLGLIHEQRRSDRDDWVTVDLPAGCTEMPEAYAIISSSENLSPYDYDSIMHYGSGHPGGCPWTMLEKTCDPITDSLCTNWDPSRGCADGDILPDDPDSLPDNCRVLATSDDFSPYDRNVLYRMYEPVLGNSEIADDYGRALIAGDFDGDGYDDVAVGAPAEGPWDTDTAGAVFLYKGTERGLVAWKVLSEWDFVGDADQNDGDLFGAALAARDIDGDGAEELFVGAPGFNDDGKNDAGAVFIYHGDDQQGPVSLSMLLQSDTPNASASADDRFGSALLVRMLNATNYHLVVGIPGENYNSVKSGAALVYQATGLSFTYTQTLYPGQATGTTAHAGDGFGTALTASDWNGDGIADLAVGAPGYNEGSLDDAGSVFLYRGGTSLVSAGRLPDSAPVADGEFGAALAHGAFRAETWSNSKPKERLAVGAPGKYNGRGKVFVYEPVPSGSSFTMPNRQILDEGMSGLDMTIEDGDRFGEVLKAADLDNDGDDELIVGVPHEEVDGINENGAVAVFRGRPTGGLEGWGKRTQHADSWPELQSDWYGAAIAIGHCGDALDNPAKANDKWRDMVVGVPGKAASGFGVPSGDSAGSIQILMGDGTIPDYARSYTQDVNYPD